MTEKPSVFLLVEDDENDVFFMKRAFKEAGLKNPLHIVSNGEEAIDYFAGRNESLTAPNIPFPTWSSSTSKCPA